MCISNEEMIGKRFGRLVVEYRVEDHVTHSGAHYAKFHCKCDCGGACDVLKYSLTSGRQIGCGCVQRERIKEKWRDTEYRKRMSAEQSERSKNRIDDIKKTFAEARKSEKFREKWRASMTSQEHRDKMRERSLHNAEALKERSITHGVWSRHPRLALTIQNHWKMCYNESNPHYRLYGAKGWRFSDEWLLPDGRPDFEAIEKWALYNGWKEDDGRVFEKDYLANKLRIKEISPRTVRFVSHKENCQRRCRYVGDDL